jgi:hypothetical protein
MPIWSLSCVSHFRSEHLLGVPLIAALRVYRWEVSPMLGENCRFVPSCSRFAEDAIRRHGVVRGGWISLRRLASCHPWGSAGGFDPVP